MTTVVRVVALVVAVFVLLELTLWLAEIGGWARFIAAAVIYVTAIIYIGRSVRGVEVRR